MHFLSSFTARDARFHAFGGLMVGFRHVARMLLDMVGDY